MPGTSWEGFNKLEFPSPGEKCIGLRKRDGHELWKEEVTHIYISWNNVISRGRRRNGDTVWTWEVNMGNGRRNQVGMRWHM